MNPRIENPDFQPMVETVKMALDSAENACARVPFFGDTGPGYQASAYGWKGLK